MALLQYLGNTSCNTDFNYYFDQWIYDEYYPTYHYNFVKEDDTLFISLYQAQEELYGRRPLFEMPVDIRIDFKDGSSNTFTIWNDQQFQNYKMEVDQEVNMVYIDPDGWILKKVFFKNDLPVGIEEIGMASNNFLYPNPFHSTLAVDNIPSDQFPLKLKLHTLTGKTISSYTLRSNQEQINVSALEDGLYLYQLFNNEIEPIGSGKIIKE